MNSCNHQPETDRLLPEQISSLSSSSTNCSTSPNGKRLGQANRDKYDEQGGCFGFGIKRARISTTSMALPASVISRSFTKKRDFLWVNEEARELSPPRLSLQYSQKAHAASVQFSHENSQAVAALNAIRQGKHHKSSHGVFAGQAHSSASAASVVLPGCSAHRVGCRAIPVANDHVIHPSTVNSNLKSVSLDAKASPFQVSRHSCEGNCPKIWTIDDYCSVCHEVVPLNMLTVPGRCQS